MFSIGQLARLFDVPVATLRYYDEIGLLKPARVDPQSHYRYYASPQFERLSTIKYFRALGVPLPTIADFFAARNLPKLEQLLEDQQQQVQAQLRTLHAIEQRLTNRLAQVQMAQRAPFDQTELVTLPARPMVALQQAYTPSEDIELIIAKLRAQYGLTESVFLGKIALQLAPAQLQTGQFSQYTGVCLLFEAGDALPQQQTQLAAGTYAQRIFHGTHADAPAVYRQLLADCQRNGWHIQGAAIETALIDYGITDQLAQAVTQIQIPVTIKA